MDQFPNEQLEGVVKNKKDYVNTFHTHQYIYNNWKKYFKIIDIVGGGIGEYQDVIVMKNI